MRDETKEMYERKAKRERALAEKYLRLAQYHIDESERAKRMATGTWDT